MKKNSFWIAIDPSQQPFYLTAWTDKIGTRMIDDHIVEQFPSLEKLDLADLSEGEMEYSGNLSPAALKQELINKGFNVM